MRILKGLIYILMISTISLFADTQDDIIKDLKEGNFRERKAAYKAALTLSYEELSNLVNRLLKYEDPELRLTGKKLSTQLGELKKNLVLDLPPHIKFEFENKKYPFDDLRFKLIYPMDDEKYKPEDIALTQIKVGDKTITGQQLDQFKFYSRNSSSEKSGRWSMYYACNTIIPELPGKHQVEFIFAGPEGKWKKSFTFERKKPREEEAFKAILELGIQGYLRGNFYKFNDADKSLDKVTTFVKEFPKSRYTSKLRYNFADSIDDYIAKSNDNKDLVERYCKVINKIGNTKLIQSLSSSKKYELKRDQLNNERIQRINYLEGLIEINALEADKDVYTLTFPKAIKPFEAEVFAVKVNSSDYKHRDLSIYKVLVNGKELYFNDIKPRVVSLSREEFMFYFDESALPSEKGDYEIEVFLFQRDNIINFPKAKYKVIRSEEDEPALITYEKLIQTSPLDINSKKVSVTVDFEPYVHFVEKYSKSYLTNAIDKKVQNLVLQLFEVRLTFTKSQQINMAKLIKSNMSNEVLKSFRYNRSRSEEYQESMKFWRKELIRKFAIEVTSKDSIKVSVDKRDLLPHENLEVFFDWTDSNYRSKEFVLLRLIVDGEERTGHSRSSSSTSNDYKKVKYKNLQFTKPGKYKLQFTYAIGKKIYSFKPVELDISIKKENKKAYGELPVKAYHKFFDTVYNRSFTFENDELHKFVIENPLSTYSYRVAEKLADYPRRDSNNEKEKLTDNDRRIIVDILNNTSAVTALRSLNYNEDFKNKERRNFWLKELKVKEEIAPKNLVCVFPKKISPFTPINLFVEDIDDLKKKITLSKVKIGKTEILFSGKRSRQTFYWKNTKWQDFTEGRYSIKAYIETPQGYRIINAGELELKSATKNKEAYEAFTKNGLAAKFIAVDYANFHKIFSDTQFTAKLREFLKKYPNDFYATKVAESLSEFLTNYYISKLTGEQLIQYVELLNTASPALALSTFNRKVRQLKDKPEENLQEIASKLKKPKQLNLLKLLNFKHKQKILPYEQPLFEVDYKNIDSAPGNLYFSSIKLDNTYLSTKASYYYDWEPKKGGRSWYLTSPFYKNFPVEPGSYEVDFCLNDFHDEYVGKSKIEIYLPENEKEALESIQSSNIKKYLSRYSSIFWAKQKLTDQIILFIKTYPESAFLDILKEKMIIDWYRTHTYYKHRSNENFFKILDLLDKELSLKFKELLRNAPYENL